MIALLCGNIWRDFVIDKNKTLGINDTIITVSGELGYIRQGEITLLLRLSGCNMSCRYCDTDFSRCVDVNTIHLAHELENFYMQGHRNILVTGGEPMLQDIYSLIRYLHGRKQSDFCFQIETNLQENMMIENQFDMLNYLRGSDTGANIHFVVDYKVERTCMCPVYNDVSRYRSLDKDDWLKFVIHDREGYEEVRSFIRTYRKALKCNICISPEHGKLGHPVLLQWLLEDKMYNIALNMQNHKVFSLE